MGNHNKPNLQLKSKYNLKSDNIINVELSVESEAGSFLPTTRKFLHIKMSTLKRNRLDDEEIDMSNPKHVRALMAYIAELENKVESVHHINIRILIPKTYQEAINDLVFAEKWKDAMDLELRVLISNFIWTEIVLLKDANLVLSRWVFDVKYISTEEVECFKACLVVRGFS